MKGVQLSKMVQELNLHNKTPDVDISKKRITLPDICLLYTSDAADE